MAVSTWPEGWGCTECYAAQAIRGSAMCLPAVVTCTHQVGVALKAVLLKCSALLIVSVAVP